MTTATDTAALEALQRDVYAIACTAVKYAVTADEITDAVMRKVQEHLGQPRQAYKPWTDQDLARLRAMRAHGHTARQIAEALDRSKRSVESQLARVDLSAASRHAAE